MVVLIRAGILLCVCLLVSIARQSISAEHAMMSLDTQKLNSGRNIITRSIEMDETRSEGLRKRGKLPQYQVSTKNSAKDGRDHVTQIRKPLHPKLLEAAVHKKTNNPAVRHRKRHPWKGFLWFKRESAHIHGPKTRGPEREADNAYHLLIKTPGQARPEDRDLIDIPTLLKQGPSNDPKDKEPEDMKDIALYKGSSTDDVFSTSSIKVHKSHNEEQQLVSGNTSAIDSSREVSSDRYYSEQPPSNNASKPTFVDISTNSDDETPDSANSSEKDWPSQVDSEKASYVKISEDPNEGAFVDKTSDNVTDSSKMTTKEIEMKQTTDSAFPGRKQPDSSSKGPHKSSGGQSNNHEAGASDDATETYSGRVCTGTACASPTGDLQNKLKEKIKSQETTNKNGNKKISKAKADFPNEKDMVEDMFPDSGPHSDDSRDISKPLKDATNRVDEESRLEEADKDTTGTFEDSRIMVGEPKFMKSRVDEDDGGMKFSMPGTENAIESFSEDTSSDAPEDFDAIKSQSPLMAKGDAAGKYSNASTVAFDENNEAHSKNFGCTDSGCWITKGDSEAITNKQLPASEFTTTTSVSSA